jgi:tetratricopeptide (TPR) repeat protein
MNDFAELCARKQEFSFAGPYLCRVLQFRERTLGPDHSDTLRTKVTLAECCRYNGNFVEAESLYSRAIEARERTLGPESYSTLRTKETLAGMLYPRALELEDPREYEKTTSLYHQLLDASQRAGSTAREKSFSHALGLAKLYQRHHKFAIALPLAEQALAVSLQIWGEGDEYTIAARKLLDELKQK